MIVLFVIGNQCPPSWKFPCLSLRHTGCAVDRFAISCESLKTKFS